MQDTNFPNNFQYFLAKQQKDFSYSTDDELHNCKQCEEDSSGNIVIVDIIEDDDATNNNSNCTKSSHAYEISHHQINLNQKMHKMQLEETQLNNVLGENIEMEASICDFNKYASLSPSQQPSTTIGSLISQTIHCTGNEQQNQPKDSNLPIEQQPDITPKHQEKPEFLEQTITTTTEMKTLSQPTIVEPLHIESFSIRPSFSRTASPPPPQPTTEPSDKESNQHHHHISRKNMMDNALQLESSNKPHKNHHSHHALSHSNSSNTTTTSSTTFSEDNDEENFSIYTLNCSSSNLNQISKSSPITTITTHSLKQPQSQPHPNSPFFHSGNEQTKQTLQRIESEKNSITPITVPLRKRTSVMMKLLNFAAYALLDVSFVVGAGLFVAGCALLIVSNVTYFFSGILLFIIGSALFLIGPLGKTLIDCIHLIKHFRWERKVKEITNLQSESSKSLRDQLHELNQDISSYRPSDLPPLKMIVLELVNDFFLIIGGLTFTIGSPLYLLNPPMEIVIIAEVNWSVGAVSYLIVSIIQFIMKQVDIIKSARNGMDVNFKCFTFMSIDLSAYLLNITSSLLFTIGSGCFLVNERSLEITGEVIWSLGCVAMIIAVLCNRIIWIKNTWFVRNSQEQT